MILKLSILQLFLYIIFAYESYKANVTHQEIIYWQRSLHYIQQFTGKRCTRASLMAQERFCKKRCQLMFYYIPSAPYKNYRYYNKTTKDCQPKVICPKIFTVFYNSTSNKCVDMSTGETVPGVDASPYKGNDTYEVQFVCINGHVGLYKGRNECICDFGWKTIFMPGTKSNPKYQKCNKGISIYEYLPAAVQIYYDHLLDLPYPHPADPDYWPKILINYLRQFKYAIQEWIWPRQIQLTLLVVPTQSLISQNDYPYLIWSGLFISIVLLVSIYEKIKNTRTIQDIMLEQRNQPNNVN